MKLATFDIFDTTLIRLCGTPDLVFELLGRRLYPDNKDKQEVFINWRMNARGENIWDIYKNCPFLENVNIDFFVKTEMEVEEEMLVPNPLILKKIDEYRKKGFYVKFLSDMYLPSDFLKRVLSNNGCLLDDEEVIVSCEYQKRKDDGTLYLQVKDRYKPSEWHHYGDNRFSDYKMAKKMGIKAKCVNFDYNYLETRLIHESKFISGWYEMRFLAGILRAARLMNSNTSEAVLAADFVAPTILSFVSFLIDQAEKFGIEDLQFLSRDGYIMKVTAEALAPKKLKYNYLFVSRKSLKKPFLFCSNADDFLSIYPNKSLIGLTVDEVLASLCTTREELMAYGIEFRNKRIENHTDEKRLLSSLYSEEGLIYFLKNKFRQEAENIKTYFDQNGLADGHSYAFVDVGWLGTSRIMLSRILKHKVYTFYYGVRGDVIYDDSAPFMSYHRECENLAPVPVIESYYCASKYLSTIGYKNDGGVIEPIFTNQNGEVDDAVVSANCNICSFIAHCASKYSLNNCDVLYMISAISADDLNNMSTKIDYSPMARIGGINTLPLVKEMSILEAFQMMFLGKAKSDYESGSLNLSFGRVIAKSIQSVYKNTFKIRRKLLSLVGLR